MKNKEFRTSNLYRFVKNHKSIIEIVLIITIIIAIIFRFINIELSWVIMILLWVFIAFFEI